MAGSDIRPVQSADPGEGSASRQATPAAFDVQRIRTDFPILKEEVYGKSLIYFDNAASSQKPSVVIERLSAFYRTQNANVHRGAHRLSTLATEAFEHAREIAGRFLNAADSREIIFTRGSTEAINLVAQGYARAFLKPGDEVLMSAMEHHSNIVPWQMACQNSGAVLRVAPVTGTGEIDEAAFLDLLGPRTRMVSILHTSNALGTINPLERLIPAARAVGAHVLIDGAQAVPHGPVDVQALDCDFFCFSGHKVYGPTGIGVLWGRLELLEQLPPYQGGGEMIRTVSFEATTYNDAPFKFEAGTPNIAGAIGLGTALEYVMGLDLEGLREHEATLLSHASRCLEALPGWRPYGTAAHRAPIFSFLFDSVHAYDLGVLLDQQGIAIRTGHHCCQPLMNRFGIEGTCRASLAFYNTTEEIDQFVLALDRALMMLR